MYLTAVFFPSTDLAPGVDEIYEESKEVFLTPGHPQDGQVVFYKVGSLHSYLGSPVFSSASQSGAVRATGSLPLLRGFVSCFFHICLGHEQVTDAGSYTEEARRGPALPQELAAAIPGRAVWQCISKLQQHQVYVEGGICETDTCALVLHSEVTESLCLSPFRSVSTEA